MAIDDRVTVIIPTSSVPSHPSTRIIEQVLTSIDHHLPGAPIHILVDGLRPEYAHRHEQYAEYTRRLADVVPANTTIVVHSQHLHHAATIKLALEDIRTPLMLYCEHDMGILLDRTVDWPLLAEAITSGKCDLVRLMLTETIHPLHMYLMLGMIDGWPLMRNRQFSGWTHLASVDFYRRLLAPFDMRAKIMVERYAASIIERSSWEQWKMTSYIPDPEASKRLFHLDGRTGDDGVRQPSYEELEVYPPQ